ncbi:MAG: helix-turn-helix domain-containing protein [Gemmataceae bacterium]
MDAKERAKTTKAATVATVRKSRADGVESRRTILDAAARLATTHGLEGLSIGELAHHIGMSKSGLYAHFKSKEELELATIDMAAEIFENDVIRKVPDSLRGIARVTALSEAFFQHLLHRVYPGGCFFATVAAQLAPRPSQARDRVMKMHVEWGAMFIAALRQACDDGELQSDVDLNQLVFEITAMMFRANFAWVVTSDDHILDQARLGIRNILSRVVREMSPSGRARKPKARESR